MLVAWSSGLGGLAVFREEAMSARNWKQLTVTSQTWELSLKIAALSCAEGSGQAQAQIASKASASPPPGRTAKAAPILKVQVKWEHLIGVERSEWGRVSGVE